MPRKPNDHYCLLGAIGWDRPAWIGAFYPDDLPPEWRLNYYNTAFECVYLPYATWRTTPAETLVVWRQDTLAHFRFLLEAPPTPSGTDTALIAALGEKAVVAHPNQAPTLVWLEPGVNLKSLAQTLQTLENAAPIYLISMSADLAQLEQTRTLLEILGY